MEGSYVLLQGPPVDAETHRDPDGRLFNKVADRLLHEINDVSVDVSTKPTNGDVRKIMLHIRWQGP